MMNAIEGYYNGTNIVTEENVTLKTGQKVIITILNEYKESQPNKAYDLSKYMGRGEKMFHGNVDQYVKGLRSDDRI